MKWYLVLLLSLFTNTVFAVSDRLTISGRIVIASSSEAFTYGDTSFILRVLDPSGLCTVYEEQVDHVNLTGSDGNFDLQLGTGTQNFPLAASGLNLKTSFDNSQIITCQSGVTYTPATTDGRLLLIKFFDGTTWSDFSKVPITSVPHAMYASTTEKLGTNVAADFLLKSSVPTCTANTFLSNNAGTLSCLTPTSTAGVTAVNVTAPLASTGGTSPTLSIAQASSTTNGYLSSSDWQTFNSKMSTSLVSGSFWLGNASDTASAVTLTGDAILTNTGSLTLKKIQGYAIDATSVAGGLMRWNTLTSTWIGQAFPACAVNETPYFNSMTDTISCQSIDVSNSYFKKGGNNFGTDATIGVLSNNKLNFITNNVTVMTLDESGNLGLSSTTPRSTLDVNGTLLMKAAVSNTGTTISFTSGNLQYTSASCGSFTLAGMKDGGSYTLAVKGTTGATCSFTAAGLTIHMPPDHTATTASTHTLYTFLVIGSDVYATWMPGL